MKFTHLKAVVGAMALSVAMVGTAQAQIVLADITSETSDPGKVEIGVSTVAGGPHSTGKIGIWVPNLPTSPSKSFVDFDGLVPSSTAANAVVTINNPTGTITDHSQFGRFDITQVDSRDLYYGEWSQTADASAGDHTVYYAGTGATTDAAANALTGTAVNYNVRGVSDYANNGQLSGAFTANFVADTLTGSIQSNTYKLDIGTAGISGASFIGGDAVASARAVSTDPFVAVATDGIVSGHFFGSGAEALAGVALFANRQYDTAFGGSQ